jgi:hypothetical protein
MRKISAGIFGAIIVELISNRLPDSSISGNFWQRSEAGAVAARPFKNESGRGGIIYTPGISLAADNVYSHLSYLLSRR